MDNDEADERKAAEAKQNRLATRHQSDRMKLMNSKTEEWVAEDVKSCALLFTFTGRSKVSRAFFRLFGGPFQKLSMNRLFKGMP